MKDDKLYLIHIQECLDRIERYIEIGKEGYFSDTKTQDAILRNLQTLAESTRRLSEPLKKKYPGIDWRAIAAFRNVAVHDYLGIDAEQIWDIIQNDIPSLLQGIRTILNDLK